MAHFCENEYSIDLQNFLFIGVPIMASFITFFFGVYIGRLNWRREHNLEIGSLPNQYIARPRTTPEQNSGLDIVTPFPLRTSYETETVTEPIMVERPLPELPSRLRDAVGNDVVKPRPAFFVDEGSSSMLTSEERRTSAPALRPEDVSYAISVLTAALRLHLDQTGSGRATPVVEAGASPSVTQGHGHGAREADSGRLPLPPQYQSEWRSAASSSSRESQVSSSVEGEAGPARPPRRKRG